MVTFETKQTEFSTSEKGTWFFAFGKKLAYPSNFTEILFTNNTRNSNRTCQVFHCSKNVPLEPIPKVQTYENR